MKRPDFLIVTKFSFSCLPLLGGKRRCQNKKIKNDKILKWKKYVVQIYKRKLYNKTQK